MITALEQQVNCSSRLRSVSDAERIVRQLYRLMLQREVDDGARADKVKRLATDLATVADLIDEIGGSAEYLTLHKQRRGSVSTIDSLDGSLNLVEQMTLIDAAAVGDTIRRIGRFLTPRAATGHSKIRVGGDGDGGYLMLDDFAEVRQAFSLGVGDDVSWDLDVARRGIVVHQFDHSVEQPPTQHPNFRFSRLRVGSRETEGTVTLATLKSYSPPAADDIVPRDLLKIDIEHDEWDAFLQTDDASLAAYRQIVGEFHWFDSSLDAEWSDRALTVLERLNKSFQSVHVHANNWAPMMLIGGVPFPAVLEVTFANRSIYQFAETAETFPTALDFPNHSAVPDFYLGRFEF